MDILPWRDWQRLELSQLVDEGQGRSHSRATWPTGNECQGAAVRNSQMGGSSFAGGRAPDTFNHWNRIAFQFEFCHVDWCGQNQATPREDDVPRGKDARVA